MKIDHDAPILISACLLGIASRYDGKSKPHPGILELTKTKILIPVCPEQLGGLPTPRDPMEILGNKVITKKWNRCDKKLHKRGKRDTENRKTP